MSDWPLFFDVPGIDTLLCPHHRDNKESDGPRSLCLAGPDGVGKSILALHASAIYATSLTYKDGKSCYPNVVYLSTDFSYHQAKQVWETFLLGDPVKRRKALTSHYGWTFPGLPLNCDAFGLTQVRSNNIQQILEQTDSPRPRVTFLDLQTNPVGDEWLFLSKLISLLATAKNEHEPLPLVVIDAIEGLDLFGGEKDSFGEPTTRRNRVARLFRHATQSNDLTGAITHGCHLIMTVEEPDSHQRLPEQFVADAVVRLRSTTQSNYLSRTIEIEKARGLPHIRGQHPYSIRSGNGKSSLSIENPDDPIIDSDKHEREWIEIQRPTPKGDIKSPIAHFLVSHSTNAVSRLLSPRGGPFSKTEIHFGLKLLDWALGTPPGLKSPCFAVLNGEPGTHKSLLAKSFLADTFASHSQGQVLVANRSEMGVAILLTSDQTDRKQLLERIYEHFPAQLSYADKVAICRHLIVRYLEPHYLASAEFLFIIRQLISVAKNVINSGWSANPPPKSKIHLVIDDFNSMLQQHPSLVEDHLLLPLLKDLFEREGISTLFVSSRDSRRDSSDSLRLLVNNLDVVQIKTWKVHFLGVRRTAISVSVPGGHVNNMIFELRPRHQQATGSSTRLDVSHEFDLYSGIEHDDPARIPLHLELYSGLHAASGVGTVNSNYLSAIESSFRKLFKGGDKQHVIDFNEATSYHNMAAFVELLDESRLDHTLIVQLDEFWKCNKQDRGLLDLVPTYLAKESLFGEFSPDYPKISGASGPNRESGFAEYQLVNGVIDRIVSTKLPQTDRVPYLWDFSFLMARRDLFWKFRYEKVPVDYQGALAPIGSIWNSLCCDSDRFNDTSFKSVANVSWRGFLQACRLMAPAGVLAFDLDLRSEALSCLVLENWLSEIVLTAGSDGVVEAFLDETKDSDLSLLYLLENHRTVLWNVLDDLQRMLSHIQIENNEVVKHDPEPSAVASRHWYSTACVAAKSEFSQVLVPLRLPGAVSTRGDWSLGIACGSRSVQLACQGLDVLTSKQMNLMRLHDGLGLPVRDLVPENAKPDEIQSLGMLRTALMRLDPSSHNRSPILFKELLALAPPGHPNHGSQPSSPTFRFVRRSRLLNYSRDRFAWRRWLGRILKDAHDFFPFRDSNKQQAPTDVEIWKQFPKDLEKQKHKFNELVQLLMTVLRANSGSRKSGPDSASTQGTTAHDTRNTSSTTLRSKRPAMKRSGQTRSRLRKGTSQSSRKLKRAPRPSASKKVTKIRARRSSNKTGRRQSRG